MQCHEWEDKHTCPLCIAFGGGLRRQHTKGAGLSSLFEKIRKSNHLQMSLQRQHFLLSYFKTPLVRSGFELTTSSSADRCSPNWASRAAVKNASFSLCTWPCNVHKKPDHIAVISRQCLRCNSLRSLNGRKISYFFLVLSIATKKQTTYNAILNTYNTMLYSYDAFTITMK